MILDAPQIVVRCQTDLLNVKEAWNLAWALDYQIKWQAGPFWKAAADVKLLPSGQPVPVDAWILDLLETSDEPGALGYHDEDGKEVPYGKVFIKTAREDGVPATEVASHEALELLADPHVNLTAFDGKTRLYPVELCDPVQGGAYDLAAPYPQHAPVGIIVSDFVLPSWFDPNTGVSTPTSYRHTVSGPFALGRGGYFSFTTQLPPQWQQKFGEKASPARVDHDDRVARRFAAAC